MVWQGKVGDHFPYADSSYRIRSLRIYLTVFSSIRISAATRYSFASNAFLLFTQTNPRYT